MTPEMYSLLSQMVAFSWEKNSLPEPCRGIEARITLNREMDCNEEISFNYKLLPWNATQFVKAISVPVLQYQLQAADPLPAERRFLNSLPSSERRRCLDYLGIDRHENRNLFLITETSLLTKNLGSYIAASFFFSTLRKVTVFEYRDVVEILLAKNESMWAKSQAPCLEYPLLVIKYPLFFRHPDEPSVMEELMSLLFIRKREGKQTVFINSSAGRMRSLLAAGQPAAELFPGWVSDILGPGHALIPLLTGEETKVQFVQASPIPLAQHVLEPPRGPRRCAASWP